MILRFPAFIPRSGPSYPFVFADLPRRRHTGTPRASCAHTHTHIHGAIRLAGGKFPAILRLHGRNNSSCPVKLLRFPRATCDESDQNLRTRTVYLSMKLRKKKNAKPDKIPRSDLKARIIRCLCDVKCLVIVRFS